MNETKSGMSQAISLAIEKGGYAIERHAGDVYIRVLNNQMIGKSEILLDPLFWQALGRALGKDHSEHVACPACGLGSDGYVWWKYHWHRYIDNLAQGGDTDKFFNDLTL